MSFAGKLARGLLSGAAAYEGKVAEQQEYDRRSNILAEREAALKQVEAQAQAARDARQAASSVDLARQTAGFQAAARVGEAKALQPIKDGERAAQQAFQVRMAYIQGNIAQNNSAAASKLQHDLAAGDVTDVKVGADGNYYKVLKGGKIEDTGIAAPKDTKVDFQGTNDSGDLVVGRGDGSISTYEGVKPKASESLFGNMPSTGNLPGSKNIPPSNTPAAPRPISVSTTGGTQEDRQPKFKAGDTAIDGQGRKVQLNAAGRWIPVR